MHDTTFAVSGPPPAPEAPAQPPAEVPDRLAAAEAKITHLELALESARVIGAAVGIVMALQKVTYDDAFATLVRASQHQNRKLRDIADEVVNYGGVVADPA